MNEFAASTGLFPLRALPRRYLWTDAFAVCNFLELFSATEDGIWLTRTRELIDQVHDSLGRFRDDDDDIARRGTRLSGCDRHPTAAGLRIGKALAGLRADEVFDESLETRINFP